VFISGALIKGISLYDCRLLSGNLREKKGIKPDFRINSFDQSFVEIPCFLISAYLYNNQ
jgi:hypothetical protein